jgi:hypothetical protein
MLCWTSGGLRAANRGDRSAESPAVTLFVRHRDVHRAFDAFTATLGRCGIDATRLRLERRHDLRRGARYELHEHSNVLPWYLIKHDPRVVARAIGARDAVKVLTFATEVLELVDRRRPASTTVGSDAPGRARLAPLLRQRRRRQAGAP